MNRQARRQQERDTEKQEEDIICEFPPCVTPRKEGIPLCAAHEEMLTFLNFAERYQRIVLSNGETGPSVMMAHQFVARLMNTRTDVPSKRGGLYIPGQGERE